MNLIDTDIQPDPFDPQRGDVYEFGAPFPQRIVVEDPPTAEDPRIRYRVDGGADSNFTSLGQFHLHLAGLGEIRGVGRVREYLPVTPDVCRTLIHQLRSTALGVDRPAAQALSLCWPSEIGSSYSGSPGPATDQTSRPRTYPFMTTTRGLRLVLRGWVRAPSSSGLARVPGRGGDRWGTSPTSSSGKVSGRRRPSDIRRRSRRMAERLGPVQGWVVPPRC